MMDSLNDCIVDYGRQNLRFRVPARTSRDTLHEKPSWFIRVRDQAGREGWGECSIIPGLSLDQASGIEAFSIAVSPLEVWIWRKSRTICPRCVLQLNLRCGVWHTKRT